MNRPPVGVNQAFAAMKIEVYEPLRFGAVEIVLGAKSGKYPDGNQVLVQGADTRVAFDTPLVSRQLADELAQVDLVLLGHVHEDHTVALGSMPHAAVQVHEADLAAAQSWDGLARHYGYPAPVLEQLHALVQRDFDYTPRPDATAYVDGQAWDLGGGVRVRAHHLPGHTAGHCALVEESSGVAFIGDIDLTGFGPYYGDASSDLGAFRRSLRCVRELDARVWVTSHHRGVLTERAAFEDALARFASKIDERSERLLGYLRDGPQTLAQLTARRILYPVGFEYPYVDSAEQRSIAQHLDWLIGQGEVRSTADAAGVASFALAH